MDIKLTIQKGGFIAFEKTGIFPEFLLFHSAALNRSWRFKHVKEIQDGFLQVNGQIAFDYFFDGLGCTIQSFENGVIGEEWEID